MAENLTGITFETVNAEERNRLQIEIYRTQGIDVFNSSEVVITATVRMASTSELVGYGEVTIDKYHIGYVNAMVKPDYQNRGLGKQILEEIITECQRIGMIELRATTIPDSVAEGILISHGFIRVDPGRVLRQATRNFPRSFMSLKL